MPWLENAMERMPIFAELGIKREVHGAISHPPDGNPLIGPVFGAKNYWCCCGTQIGIGWGPGLTRELARWIVHSSADINMREFDPRRFGPYATKEWQVVKAKEDYCLRHEIPFPHFNRLDGRPVKPSPLYECLKEKGAVYEEVFGHERPRWFANGQNGLEQRDTYAFARPDWQKAVALESKAVREHAGIMDISAFTKVEVLGPDAEKLLDRLVANRLPQKTGGIALTHMLNRRGRIELETTVVRLAEDRFYLVCAAFFEQRLIDHIRFNMAGERAEIINRSSDWAALSLNGPASRDILAACSDADLTNAGFRWMSAQEITVAGVKLWAFRMSYAGELGWEFHIPRDHALAIYDALWVAGEIHGIADYGSFTMNALRMEKGFKGAGELTNEVTLPEADVMRFVKPEKGEFLGREATLASMKAAEDGSMPWVCAYLEIEPDGIWDGNGGEAVRCDGKNVGSTASVAYSPTYDKVLAFAYIKPHAAKPGTEIEVIMNEKWRKGRVLAEPIHDPQSILPRIDTKKATAE
jgi:dimethylglycine dehydrogenase